MQKKNRTYVEVDLDAIRHNYRVICRAAKSPVLCVIKANAYGHGALRVAQTLQEMGAPYFAVATVSEGMQLRTNGIDTPILILGYVDRTDMEDAIRNKITVPIYDRETAERLNETAGRCGMKVKVHFTLDTGMTRLGFSGWDTERCVEEMAQCCLLENLIPEGLFTHFAVADVPDGEEYTKIQFQRFTAVRDGLADRGIRLPLCHCANSGTIEQYAEMHCNMTRAGIILYGYAPDASLDKALDLRPAMTVYAHVVQVRDIPADTTISYGRTFRTEKETRIAVITMGYADGFLRTGSGRAKVLVGGKKARVLGRICMDMCMVEVPEGVCLQEGDLVTVFGPEGWTAADTAEAAGTISYEVLCAMSHRLPRFYKN